MDLYELKKEIAKSQVLEMKINKLLELYEDVGGENRYYSNLEDFIHDYFPNDPFKAFKSAYGGTGGLNCDFYYLDQIREKTNGLYTYELEKELREYIIENIENLSETYRIESEIFDFTEINDLIESYECLLIDYNLN